MRRYELTERGKIVIALVLVVLLLVLPSAILAFKAMSDESAPPTATNSAGASKPPPNSGESPTQGKTDSPPPESGGTFSPTGDSGPGNSVSGTHEPPNVGDTGVDLPYESETATTPEQSAGTPGEQGSPTTALSPDAPTAEQTGTDSGSPQPPVQETTPGTASPSEPPTPPGTISPGVTDSISFVFTPGAQTKIDAVTASKLDDFLKSSRNTQTNTIAVETPKLQAGEAAALMAALKAELSARGVREQRLEHISRATAAQGADIRVTLYYLPDSGK